MFNKNISSQKCLGGETGETILVDTFYIGTDDGMSSRGKIASQLGETFFLLWFIIVL